jgi:glycine/D-amino acid oxidase-like deaminating enzyme
MPEAPGRAAWGVMAGLGDRGLMPLRRTAITIEPPDGVDVSNWLFVNDIGDAFYFKPEAGLVLASPVDETPSEPCDAQPEEIDVATVAWRIEEATTMKVSRIRRKWAGLRTFTPDRTPLFEFDANAPGILLACRAGRLRHPDGAVHFTSRGEQDSPLSGMKPGCPMGCEYDEW